MLEFYLNLVDDYEDRITLEKIYDKYKTLMYNVAFEILKNQSDSEDAVQETFISIAQNMKTILKLEKSKILPYIIVTTRNKSLDICRKNKNTSKKDENTSIDSLKDDVDYFENIDYNDLVKAITELPPIYRDILYLLYVQEMSVKEVSKTLNIASNTVWKRNKRAKNLLKEKLKELDIYV